MRTLFLCASLLLYEYMCEYKRDSEIKSKSNGNLKKKTNDM